MNWMAIALILLILLCIWLATQAVKNHIAAIGMMHYIIHTRGETLDEATLERISRDAGKIFVKYYTGRDVD